MKSGPSCQAFLFCLLLTWASVGCTSTVSPEPALVPAPPANAPALVTDLFLDANAPANSTPDPLVLRARAVTLNTELLNAVSGPPGAASTPRSLRLSLFPDTIFTALPERVEPNPNGFTWFGRVENVDKGQVLLVMNGGVLVGTVRAGGKFFQVHILSGATYEIQEINPKALPPD